MDKDTIQKLNQLNIDFYNTVATDFDKTRQYFWEGWEKIPPYLDEFNSLRCLDMGCGNGRFGQFLLESCPQIKLSYTGVDANHELLQAAKQSLIGKIPALHFQQQDIINSLINDDDFLENQQFQLIVCFGVFHHIPTYNLRKKLLSYLLSKIDEHGYLVISFWQFYEFERFRKKIINDEKSLENKIEIDKLEKNDFILDWNRGKNALRYCHYTDNDEQKKLFEETKTTIIKSYRADAKESNVNQYFILKKNG